MRRTVSLPRRFQRATEVLALGFVAVFPFVVWRGATIGETIYAPKVKFIGLFLAIWIATWMLTSAGRRLADFWRLARAIRPYEWALMGYGAFMLVASLVSPLSGYALFGNPTTQTGAFLQLGMIALFLIFSRVVRPKLALTVFGAVSLILAVITIAEALGARPTNLLFVGEPLMPYARLAMGRESVTVSYFLLSGATAVAAYLTPRLISRPLNVAWVLAAAAGIVVNPGRAGWIAAAVTLVACVVLVPLRRRLRELGKVLALVVSVAILLPPAVGLLAGWLQLPGLESEDANLQNTTSFQTRALLWKAGLRMFRERPLFGWGDDNFSLVVFDYLTSDEAARLCELELGLLVPQGGKVVNFGNLCAVDDGSGAPLALSRIDFIWPHNVIVQEVVSHGILGLISLLAFVGLYAYSVANSGRDHHIWLLPLVAYGTYLLAWFYIATVTPYFWIVLGISVHQATRVDDANGLAGQESAIGLTPRAGSQSQGNGS